MSSETAPPLVPRLRFPGFESAGAWTMVPLGSIAAVTSDRVGDADCVPMSVTTGVGLVSQEDKFGRVIAGDSFKNYLRLRTNEFAYNKSSTKEYPEGFLTLYPGDRPAAGPASIFTCFRLQTDQVVPFYLNHLFAANLHGKWLRQFIQVGARAHGSLSVSDKDLMALPFPLPMGYSSREEQQKIADCLNSLDELIAAQARKVGALEQHKAGLMQRLFPREGESRPQLRFPDFDGAADWQVKTLDSLAERGSGHTPSKSNSAFYNGGIKWISLADSKRLDCGLIFETQTEISADGIRNSSAVVHPAGTVVLSRDAGVGKSAVMAEPMAVSQHFVVWTCQPDLLFNWFLYYLLQNMKPVFEQVASGSTVKTIGVPFFKAMHVAVPEIIEQELIANCLRAIDERIAAARSLQGSLAAHKKALMQRLFPSPEAIGA
jgi:type I restriction enzyme S subunit